MIEHNLAMSDFKAPDFDRISVGVELDVVPKANDGYDNPKLHGALPPDHDDAVQKVASLRRVHERYNAVAELHLNQINLQKRCHAFGLALFLSHLFCGILYLYLFFLLARMEHRAADKRQRHCQRKQR
ncbi:hypothetical protein SDC9_209104 [bioreactor metagenome]|uniref:Uncharacterized protein n=1 Tax=bioreactor metagenome TaxID=1076179 RepID=A0A645JCF2_9ZZZZ